MSLWKVTGVGRTNKPVELTVNASDHNEAVRIASQRRVRVESCVLWIRSTMPPADVLGKIVCEPYNTDQQLFD